MRIVSVVVPCFAALVHGCSSDGGGSGAGGSAGAAGASGTGGSAPESVCALPTDKGPCDGTEFRWAFDTVSGKCVLFLYGGCEGNDNSFVTADACVAKCAPGAAPCDVIDCGSGFNSCYYVDTQPTCAVNCGEGCPWDCVCGTSCPECTKCVDVCLDHP